MADIDKFSSKNCVFEVSLCLQSDFEEIEKKKASILLAFFRKNLNLIS
jgi:hypothetical protein